MCKHCWDDTEGVHHKDFIRGYSDDGFEETRHRPKSKKNKVSKKPGCPGNDGKAHVYVWTTEGRYEDLFFKYFGFHKFESKICAGCMKSGMKSRRTERYLNKFKPIGKYDTPEYNDAGYAKFRKDYIARYGWSRAAYGSWF